jgi:hypothetical protein
MARGSLSSTRRASALVLAALAVAAGAAADVRNLTDLPGNAALAEPDLSAPVYAPTSPLASSTLFTDRATFVAAFPALRSEDFEDGACAGITGFAAPLDSTSSNACFSPGDIPTGLDIRDEPLNDAGGGSPTGLVFVEAGQAGALNDAVVANTYVDAFRLNFSPPVTAVGLELVNFTAALPTRVRFYNGAILVHEENLASLGPAGAFLALHDPAGITQVEVYADDAATPNGAEGVYEVLFGDAGFGGVWQLVTSLNTARSRTAAVYFPPNGNFYALGGEATGGNRAIPIEEYDPVANTWTDRSLLTTGVSNTGAATIGNFIYLPGGYTGAAGVTDLQIFDPLANTVNPGPAMPAGNYAHAVVARGTFLHVLGGSGTGAAGTTHFIFDTVGGGWSNGAAVPVAVQYPAAASDGQYVYLLGGNTTNIPTVQRYDPVGDSWTPMPDMTSGRGGAAAFFDGRRIWAVGGGWATYLPSTEYFDGTAWHPGPALNVGVRTEGVAFGWPLALKAAGWNAGYSAVAEILDYRIFSDGFESGDMSAWSATAP